MLSYGLIDASMYLPMSICIYKYLYVFILHSQVIKELFASIEKINSCNKRFLFRKLVFSIMKFWKIHTKIFNWKILIQKYWYTEEFPAFILFKKDSTSSSISSFWKKDVSESFCNVTRNGTINFYIWKLFSNLSKIYKSQFSILCRNCLLSLSKYVYF